MFPDQPRVSLNSQRSSMPVARQSGYVLTDEVELLMQYD
jgi:hypothetical protein